MSILTLALVLATVGCGGSDTSSSTPAPTATQALDSDGDGWTDEQEAVAGTDKHEKDTDGDGYWDPQDANPLDPNIPVAQQTATPTPEATTTYTPTQTPKPATPIPTPKKAEKVIIFHTPGIEDLSKVQAYAWAAGLSIELVTKASDVKELLGSNEYAGIYYASASNIPDWLVFDLSKFVRSGGRAFIAISHKQIQNGLKELQDSFGISVAKELFVSTDALYKPGGKFTPLWANLTVGIPPRAHRGIVWPAFLVADEGSFTVSKVSSQKANLQRAMSAYKKHGAGEVIFLVSTHENVCTPDCSRITRTIIDDVFIDYYDNKQGSLNILKWLAGKREYVS